MIYTPNLKAEGYPDDRLIAVDLEQGVTRVLNSDYFGESKKGGLRMWNKLVYDRGGIPLHAGCKIIPTERRQARRPDRRSLGHRQDDDDLHAPERLAAGAGRLRRLDARRPGLRDRGRLLRQDLRAQPGGRADHLRRRHPAAARTSRTSPSTATRSTSTTNYTMNGRATFPFSVIGRASADEIDEAHFLLILNKNENIVPAVAKLEGAAGGRLLHARRDHRHERRRRATRPASSCAFPARTRSSRCPTTCRATASSSCSTRTRSRSTS